MSRVIALALSGVLYLAGCSANEPPHWLTQRSNTVNIDGESFTYTIGNTGGCIGEELDVNHKAVYFTCKWDGKDYAEWSAEGWKWTQSPQSCRKVIEELTMPVRIPTKTQDILVACSPSHFINGVWTKDTVKTAGVKGKP